MGKQIGQVFLESCALILDDCRIQIQNLFDWRPAECHTCGVTDLGSNGMPELFRVEQAPDETMDHAT